MSLPTHVIEQIRSSGLSIESILGLQHRLCLASDIYESNRVRGALRAPSSDDYADLARLENRVQLGHRGTAALEAGQLALLILNGGMATRFGGLVKGAVPIQGDHSFLAMKLRDGLRVAARFQTAPPIVILMNSRSTHQATLSHLAAHNHFGYPRDRIWCFEQGWSVRFEEDGRLFADENGVPSYYGPGHGDALYGLRDHDLLGPLRDAGVSTILLSNVDNIVATIDPVLLGFHLSSPRRMSVELVDRWSGDRGGAPYWLDDRLQLIEGFRLPPDHEVDVAVFNSNTFWLDLTIFEDPPDLTWFAVSKEGAGRKVVQFERLAGEVSSFVACEFIRVPRSEKESRLMPVKTPEDLLENRDALVHAWSRAEDEQR